MAAPTANKPGRGAHDQHAPTSPYKAPKTPQMGRYSQTSPKAPRKRFQRPLVACQHKRSTPPYKTTRHSTEHVRLGSPIPRMHSRSIASTRQPDESSKLRIASRIVRCKISRISRVCWTVVEWLVSMGLNYVENIKTVAFCNILQFSKVKKGVSPLPPFTKEIIIKVKRLEGKRRKRALR